MASKSSSALIFNFISYLIIGVSGILINIIVINFYDVDTLGYFNEVYAFFIILSQLGAGGIHLSTLRHVPMYKDDNAEQKKILVAAILSGIVINAVLLVLFYFIVPSISRIYGKPELELGLYSIIPAVLFISLNKICLAYVNGLNKMKTFAVFQSLRFILMLATLLALISFNIESNYISTIFTFAEAALLLAILVTLFKDIFLQSATFKSYKEWIKKHFSFGKHAVVGNLLTDLNTRVDVLVLGLFCSHKLIGIYTFAATLAEGFQQLPIVLRNFYSPRIVHFLVKENDALFTKVLNKIKRKSYLIVAPLGVIGIALYPVLLMIINVDVPLTESWIVFGILAIGIAIAGGYMPIQFLMNQAGLPLRQTQFLLVLFLINLVLNFMLIPVLGITGAAVGTAVATICIIPVLKGFSKRFVKVHV